MKIVKYRIGKEHFLGHLQNEKVINLTNLDSKIYSSFTQLINAAHRENKTIERIVTETLNNSIIEPGHEIYPKDEKRFDMPLLPPEIWACGVTYSRSQEAREFETGIKGIYDLVYDAKRPEIFFKTTGSRCVGPYQSIGIRGDSNWSVPEPELAFILGPDCQVVGFTAGNDVSARDIEGENPLYLPQAKTFEGCCALGPSIVTVDEVGAEPKLRIECEIIRDGEIVFGGITNTSKMKRSIEELRSYLCLYNPIPSGSVCLTGTGIVPPDDFTLKNKDIVKIEIDKIGTLINPVRTLD
jgi:2-dehydro-3-deoxy-D-arabinonate dehydratase